jgi:hypothetical protein
MIGISPVFPASTCQLLLTGAGSECCERDDHKFWMTYCASFVPSLVSIRDGTRRPVMGSTNPIHRCGIKDRHGRPFTLERRLLCGM